VAAQLLALGPLTVPTPGVPVPFSSILPSAPSTFDVNNNVHACIMEAISSNAAKVYIGMAGMNKTTLANVLMVLPVPTVNLIPTFSISVTQGANALDLADLYLDADNAGNGIIVSAIIA
jgi:hypothetical protein